MRARASLHRCRRVCLTSLLALAVPLTAACSKPVDLKKSLQVASVTTGWFDAGIVNGKNKLVPSVSFALKNVSDRTISSVQLNVVFRRVGDADEWDTAFVRGIDATGLAPDAETTMLTVRAKLGYTSEEPRAEMLQHRLFVDATVKIFAKHGSAQWTELSDMPIRRQLLTAQ